MAEVPVARGLFLCDQVVVEEQTRNVSLINCFATREVDAFPSAAQQFTAFALLTNGRGTIPVELRAVRRADDAVIWQHTQEVLFTDPFQVLRYALRFRRLVFPTPGSYSFDLLAGGEILAQTRIEVHLRRSVS